MDIEWAKDGNTGELFIVQARPETVQSQAVRSCSPQRAQDLADGRSVGKLSVSKAHLILDVHKLDNFQAGKS